MLDHTRPDAKTVRRIKAVVTERFDRPDTATPAVSELRCPDPDRLPGETAITARETNGAVRDWRFMKPLCDIETTDIETLAVW